MKDPVEHFAVEPPDYGEDICAKDGQDWPCNTYQKWLKSDSYRIAELEAKLGALMGSVGRRDREIDSLKYCALRNEKLVDALILYANKGGGSITIHDTQDVLSFTDTNSPRTIQIAGHKDFKVTYENAHETYINGELIECRRWHGNPDTDRGSIRSNERLQ